MNHTRQAAPERATHAVATHRLAKRYGRQEALAGIDLRVPEGAVYVLVGANGAGKSTTLKLLMNLERPSGGAAEVFGMDTGRSGPRVRAQVGYLPEHHDAPYGWMRCGSLLRHAAAYYPSWEAAYADELCRDLELRPERRVGALSKGEARRLQLVLALAHRPPLLLLDEPTDGLDPLVRRRVLALLARHLADAPTTVLLSTHRIYEVESLADHLGVLHEGRLAAQLPREQLQRTARRYRADLPEGWEAPPGLGFGAPRLSSGGREAQWTLIGEEPEVIERLAATGARVREVTPLSLEDAVLAFLTQEGS
jgi:ABC-2 type transport system ATP-binding protein